MDEDTHDTRLFAVFERHDEFVEAQNTLLAADLFAEPSREEQDAEIEYSRKLMMIVSRPSFPWLTCLDWVNKSLENIKNSRICGIRILRASCHPSRGAFENMRWPALTRQVLNLLVSVPSASQIFSITISSSAGIKQSVSGMYDIYLPSIHSEQLDSSLMKWPISRLPWISFSCRQGL